MPEEGLEVISAAEILELSPRNKVVLQDEKLPVFDGFFFSNDEDAVEFKAEERPAMMGKLDIPLALTMHGEFREGSGETTAEMFKRLGIDIELPQPSENESGPEGTGSSNRSNQDFRIVMPDREVNPSQNRECQVMPYVLFNGVTSLMLRVERLDAEGDNELFRHDSFWLNVYDEGAYHPISKVADATLQVILNPSDAGPEKTLERYLALKEDAGQILQRIINAPVVAEATP
ncbi:MAG TPA: hypothetical protein VFK11_03495 [Candidatus Saccharimonadales bacterium]|nr:hypothetical protein [Candidatus Saccharimonadales bacterium]